jgi:hypothetical protein
MTVALLVRCSEPWPVRAQATDLSTVGCRLQACACFRSGDVVTLEFPECEPRRAKVTWARGAAAGVEFEAPIPDDVIVHLVGSRTPAHRP